MTSDKNTDTTMSTLLAELESAWVTIMAFAPACWDSLDGIENTIAAATGETSGQVCNRLYQDNRSFVKPRNRGQRKARQTAREENARLQAIIDKLPKDAKGNPVTSVDALWHPQWLQHEDVDAMLYWMDADAGAGYAESLCATFIAPVCECHITRAAAEAAREGGA